MLVECSLGHNLLHKQCLVLQDALSGYQSKTVLLGRYSQAQDTSCGNYVDNCMLPVMKYASMQFAHIWSSPETQAEECMAYDAFPVVLSFLQAVLN